MDVGTAVKQIYDEAKEKADRREKLRKKTADYRKARIEHIVAEARSTLRKVGVFIQTETDLRGFCVNNVGATSPFVVLSCTAARTDDDSCWINDEVHFFKPNQLSDVPLWVFRDHTSAVLELARMAIAETLK